MEYGALLIIHILGAVLTGIFALYACLAILLRTHSAYRNSAIVLGSLAAFEVVTGTALAVLSSSVTVASVCGNIALYLLSVGLVLSILAMRMRARAESFPSVQALSPVLTSMFVLIAGLVLGL